jgi:hypothetical protein
MGAQEFQNEVSVRIGEGNYNKVWYLCTVALSNARIEQSQVKKVIKSIFEKKYESIKKSDSVINFIDGMAYFLTNQTTFNNQEIIGLVNGFENNLFIETFKNKQTQHSELFSKYRSSDRYQLYKETISTFMEKKERDTVKNVLSYMTGLNTNQCEILKVFYQKGFYYYDIVKDTIDKFKLDINVAGLIGTPDRTENSQRKWAFTHLVMSDTSMQGQNFFYDFIKDFGKSIDFDAQFSYIERDSNGNYPTWKSKNVLESLWDSSVPLSETLNRTDAILKNCTMNEKVLAQITKYLFSGNIARAYSHEVYDTLFQNEVFKSSSLDKGSLVTLILNLDKDSSVIKAMEENKGVVNPVKLVLDKLLIAFSSAKPPVHPFISWATNNKKFSKDTFNYLYSLYATEIKALPLDQLNELPNPIKAELTSKGVSNLEKTGFFSMVFGKAKPAPVPVEVIAPVYTPNPTELSFNDKLFERVTDADVKYYIESIKLNAEQFEAVFDNTLTSKNNHYMINLLPKFLNKTVENYLSFNALDPEEAKENTLVQLKLLNKKAVDILNEGLSNEKEKIVTQSKVNKNIMNQY